jgi:ABC-type taurine transport system ATPase subunit
VVSYPGLYNVAVDPSNRPEEHLQALVNGNYGGNEFPDQALWQMNRGMDITVGIGRRDARKPTILLLYGPISFQVWSKPRHFVLGLYKGKMKYQQF